MPLSPPLPVTLHDAPVSSLPYLHSCNAHVDLYTALSNVSSFDGDLSDSSVQLFGSLLPPVHTPDLYSPMALNKHHTGLGVGGRP
jgi:hypothetical protein